MNLVRAETGRMKLRALCLAMCLIGLWPALAYGDTDDEKKCDWFSDSGYQKVRGQMLETDLKKLAAWRRTVGNYITICSRLLKTRPDKESDWLRQRQLFYMDLAKVWAHWVENNYKIKTSYPEAMRNYKLALDDNNRMIEVETENKNPYLYDAYGERGQTYGEMAQFYADRTDKIQLLKLAAADFQRAAQDTSFSSDAKRYGKQLKCFEAGGTNCPEW